jgi:hypothetical protein
MIVAIAVREDLTYARKTGWIPSKLILKRRRAKEITCRLGINSPNTESIFAVRGNLLT